MSDPAARRKPPGRLWLFGPFILLGLILLALTFVWWMARFRIEDGLRQQTAALTRQGYRLETSPLHYGGYPYRLSVDATDLRLSTPSGWVVRFQNMKGEATLIELGHWVFATTGRVTLTRPQGGDVSIAGASIRASLAGLDRPAPRLALEGVNLIFTTPVGARPFSLSRAGRIEVYSRTGLRDATTAEALIRLEDAQIAPGTMLAPLIGAHRMSTALSLRLTRYGALRGANWTMGGQNWVRAGGHLEADPTAPPFSDLQWATTGGVMSFTSDGRPSGALPVTLTSKDGSIALKLPLSFQGGAARLGPLLLGPSPRLF